MRSGLNTSHLFWGNQINDRRVKFWEAKVWHANAHSNTSEYWVLPAYLISRESLLYFVPWKLISLVWVRSTLTNIWAAHFLKVHNKPADAEAHWPKTLVSRHSEALKTTVISQWFTKKYNCAYRSFNIKIYNTSKPCKTHLLFLGLELREQEKVYIYRKWKVKKIKLNSKCMMYSHFGVWDTSL